MDEPPPQLSGEETKPVRDPWPEDPVSRTDMCPGNYEIIHFGG